MAREALQSPDSHAGEVNVSQPGIAARKVIPTPKGVCRTCGEKLSLHSDGECPSMTTFQPYILESDIDEILGEFGLLEEEDN